MARSRSLKLPRRCLGSSGSSVGFTRCQSFIPPSSASSSIGVSIQRQASALSQWNLARLRSRKKADSQYDGYSDGKEPLEASTHPPVQLLLALHQVAFVHSKPSKSWELPTQRSPTCGGLFQVCTSPLPRKLFSHPV